MRIEFATVGDDTNVEVNLIEDLGGDEVRVDQIFTADHQGGIHFGEDRGQPIHARYLFQWVEESWAPPIIGGRYGHLHPHWHEREEKRKARQ